MIIGVLNIELFLPASNSLKTKRFAIKSLKDKLRNRFNVSVAEIDFTDKWQRSSLGIALVSNESKHIESIFEKIIDQVYNDYRVQVVNLTKTFS
jgi:uncharacterized protein YlxP (DUF503 family)